MYQNLYERRRSFKCPIRNQFREPEEIITFLMNREAEKSL